MVQTLGQLVTRLREERGMTQTQLAAASGVGSGTISRIERDSENQVRRSTMGRLIASLDEAGSIPTQDLEQLYSLAGMTKLVVAVKGGVTGSAPANRLSEYTATLNPDAARCHWYIADLVDRIGVLPVLKILEGVAQIAGVALEPPVEIPRTIAHISPPIQRDGYVEQVVTDFEVPAKPAAPATRPVDRRRVGG